MPDYAFDLPLDVLGLGVGANIVVAKTSCQTGHVPRGHAVKEKGVSSHKISLALCYSRVFPCARRTIFLIFCGGEKAEYLYNLLSYAMRRREDMSVIHQGSAAELSSAVEESDNPRPLVELRVVTTNDSLVV